MSSPTAKEEAMRFEVTQKGVYDKDNNRVPVGAVIEHDGDTVPGYLKNKGRVLDDGAKTAVTNPAKGSIQESTNGYSIKAKGGGWFVVTKEDAELTKSVREQELAGFGELSAEDQAAFIEAHKPAEK
jgi:hypothetical protein